MTLPNFSLAKARVAMLREPFFMRPTELVARELLGAILVRQIVTEQGMTTLAGRIVETEAYLHSMDAASHSYRGKTPRNATMFVAGGALYVYQIYGIHHCINVVTEQEGRGCAVLIRAIEPLWGVSAMQQQRGVQDVRTLCNGPGKLAKAFGFDLSDDGTPLTSARLFICIQGAQGQGERESFVEKISVTARVGITKDAHKPLRFLLAGNPFVSKGKPSA